MINVVISFDFRCGFILKNDDVLYNKNPRTLHILQVIGNWYFQLHGLRM